MPDTIGAQPGKLRVPIAFGGSLKEGDNGCFTNLSRCTFGLDR